MVEFVSFPLRYTFREYCVSYLSVRALEDVFYGFHIEPGKLEKNEVELLSSSRRITIERFYKAFNWSNVQDVQLFLKILSHILNMPIRYVGYNIIDIDEQQCADRQRILDLSVQDGLKVDGNDVSLLESGGVKGKIKNLIFAANGPKPEIILRDATNNDIQIVKNAQYCLIYDQPIPERGLLWKDLVEWWSTQKVNSGFDRKTVETSLYRRLLISLASSPPEQILFQIYMKEVAREWKGKLFTLIPQVYLHYDPYTIKQRFKEDEGKLLKRQRIDFLLLFSNRQRVVIEVDGQQHYSSEEGKSSPTRYAEMVAEDRRLKLSGYEIYRFGGSELLGDGGREIVLDFFSELLRRYS